MRDATVAGTVTDTKGRPIADAVVGVSVFVSPRIPFSVLRPVTTAHDGSWRVAGLPFGEADLLTRAQGFGPETRLLEIREPLVEVTPIVLREAMTAAFLVVDMEDRPIAGAGLEIEPALSAITDDRGRARVEGLPAATEVAVRVEARGFVPLRIRQAPPIDEAMLLRMVRAVRVSGRLVDPAGQPLSGGRVRMETGSESRTRPLGAGGDFELELPPHQPARLVLFSPASTEVQVSVPAGSPGETRDLGDIETPRGLIVTGRVVATDGQPVVGARLWVPRGGPERALLSWIHADHIEAASGADGSFFLTGLPARSAKLRIETPGLALQHVQLNPQPDQTTIDLGDIELETGSTVRIFTETPHPDATARVDLGNAWLEPDMLSAPVLDGVATVPHVPAGRYTASIVSGDRLVCDVAFEVPAHAEPVDVDCEAASMQVQGTVVIGHQPGGPGWLSWRPPGERAHAAILRHGNPEARHQSRVLWGGRPDERVEVDASGFFASERLRPGAWEVAWTGGDGYSASQRVELPESPHHELVIRFSAGSLEGTVSEPDGTPVARARVRDQASGAWTVSGDDGAFVLHAAGEGPFALQARSGKRSSQLARIENTSNLTEPIALVLADPEQLVLEVFDPSEQPVAGALVFLQEPMKSPRILTTGLEGRAVAQLHPPRASRARAATYIDGSWVFSAWQAIDEPEPSLSLQQREVGAIRVSVPQSADTTESVRLVTAGDWDVSWLSTRLGQRPTVTAGHPWMQHGLPPGIYEVTVGRAHQQVEVEPGQIEDIELEP